MRDALRFTNISIFCATIAAALCLTYSSASAAESGTIKAHISDKLTGDPLIGANVVVLNTSLGGAANIEGNVVIVGVPAGEVTLKISFIGYRNMSEQVIVPDGGVVEKEFRLSPHAVEGQEVVVTAQARGQNEAINQQIASNTLVNVVSSEKMSELPDANIAESIGRLPGVSLQRNAGEATAVVVRGLSPKYNNVSIEGVPMVSTNASDRGIDLSLLSDDLVKGVEVSKTLRPDMDADALGGTVNLTLRTAQDGLHYDLRGNGGYTKLNDSYKNYKFAGTAGDRFADNSFGLLVQGNIEEKQLPSNNFNATYAQPQSTVLANGDTITNLSTQSATLTTTETKRHRYGISMILDYASDLVDVKFYNVYDQKRDSILTRSNQSTFSNSQFLSQIFANDTKTEQRTHSLQFLWKFGKTELPISLSYTRGDLHSPNGQQLNIYGYEDPDFTPIKDNATHFTQPSVLMNYMGVQQPQNSWLSNFYMSNSVLKDISYDLKADWKVPFRVSDDLSGVITAGGKYHNVDRENNLDKAGPSIQYGGPTGTRLDLINYLTSVYPGFSSDPSAQSGVEAHNFVDPTYTGGNVLGYTIGPQYNAYQLLSINRAFYALSKPLTYRIDGVNSYNQDYTDKENTSAGYLEGEFNIGTDLTVISGARFQEEKSDISAYHIIVDPLSPIGYTVKPNLVETKRDNPNWFPSVNLKYKATDNVQILAAAYRSESLPSFIDVSPVMVLTPGGFPQIAGGNPLLKPSTATNLDLGASLFSNTIGLFTVNLFYKQISDLIYTMNNYNPFLTAPVVNAPAGIRDRLPEPAYYDTSYVKLLTGTITTNIPMNDPEKAFLRGVEFSWQTHLWYLPWVLDGIVLDLNAAFMSSNQLYPYFSTVRIGGTAIKPITALVYETRPGHLQDQPKATYNAILGWDHAGFSARFSLRYQQVTLTGLDTQFGVRDAYYDNVTLIDLSVKQQLLPGLAVFADVTNVNGHIDSYYLNYFNGNNGTSGQLPTSEQTYGMNAQLGLSFTY